MQKILYSIALALLQVHGATALAESSTAKRDATVERGRYLVKITGCNDCHTAQYAEKAGAVPEAAWLTGVAEGSQGPWGTTYPANLRLHVGTMSEGQWTDYARRPMRPPMPWFALRDMTDTDVRAIYRYVKSLGPAGQPAPAYVPPNEKPATPVIAFPAPTPSR